MGSLSAGDISNLMYEVFILSLKLGGPPLILSLIVGVFISILQAATQIHEQTITFLPKIIIIGIVLLITGSKMLTSLQDFTAKVFSMI